ncbi:MAG: hypothetical protein KF678_06245 [Phycisphaeraceae bacterium]|nr:hypothetical protein [Phycisphaeraceae bacterium]
MLRRFPLFRLGLTVVAGSLFASLIYFYLALGENLSTVSGSEVSTEPRDLLTHFRRDFLFAGTTPAILFYIGLGILLLGIVRNFARRPDA